MIKKLLQNIFNEKESIEFTEWRTNNSILDFISSNLDESGNLNVKAHDLPDENKDDDNMRFALGLMDAMLRPGDLHDSKMRIAELAKHLKGIATKGDKISKQEFYRQITENDGVIGIMDDFLLLAGNDSLPTQPYLFNFANDLMARTDKRNAVKFGIAITLCMQ